MVPSLPATITVTKTADTDGFCILTDCSLREAIKSASGDAVQVPAGVYTLTLGRELLITGDGAPKDLTLTGAGAATTIIQAAIQPNVASARVFHIAGGQVAISGVTIRHGNPSSNAGGILDNDATLTITSTMITKNGGTLGGIVNGGGGRVTLMNSTVSDNTGGADSAGILNSQNAAGTPRNTLTVVNSTISNNSGRGLWNGGTLTVVNTTISGNTYGGHGAGIYNFSCCGNENATASVNNSTITGNSSSSKSGIWNNQTVKVSNTIIAGNTAPSQPDCNSFTSLGYNLVGDSSCSFGSVTSDMTNVDPKLGPLANNGGPTLTHALMPGSGVNSCAATDQRGVVRPQGPRCDIGAFELVPPPRVPATITVTKTGDTDATCFATDCSLREAIKAAQSGDKIVVPKDIYTLTLGRELLITGDGEAKDPILIPS